MTRYLFRSSIWIALSAAVVVGAAFVVFQEPPTQGKPTPLPVASNEYEIVWLYAATDATSWERFVAAVRQTAERLRGTSPQAQADDRAAFPQQTTAVPQVSLTMAGNGPRFVFRWYKLTSDWKTRDWIEALLQRQPPPLAVIGGSSSDNARELATYLQVQADNLPATQRPLLLLTSATADRVTPLSEGEAAADVPLARLYPERTFRFCFTNRQMADVVSDFIWSRDDLRPDKDPAHVALWSDDSYSRDLIDGFRIALRRMVAQDLATYWAWWTGQFGFGAWPFAFGGGIFPIWRQPLHPEIDSSTSTFCMDLPPTPHVIASSVGGFATPNHYEAKAAGQMLDGLLSHAQTRPLLIVAGQSQPSRRFLRGLMRGAPSLSKHQQFVVATGDAITFNTVYRDRDVAWNVQDLPFPLVFFCHRNPIDADAGFRAAASDDERNSTAATGTEDVLLFGDIVEALAQTGLPARSTPCAHATELAQRLLDTRLRGERIFWGGDGVPLFDREGQRQSGTGEHVVYLQPTWDEDFKDRLLPRATIEVWSWRRRDAERNERGQHWQRRGEPLTVSYSETRWEGGDARGRR